MVARASGHLRSSTRQGLPICSTACAAVIQRSLVAGWWDDEAMYASFREFYPLYLGEHTDRRCRRLHFLGSWLVIASIVIAIATRNPWWLIGAPVCGYGCAWIGHFVYEKNKPATFRHPVYSLMGDWAMFADILRGRVRM